MTCSSREMAAMWPASSKTSTHVHGRHDIDKLIVYVQHKGAAGRLHEGIREQMRGGACSRVVSPPAVVPMFEKNIISPSKPLMLALPSPCILFFAVTQLCGI